jgi:hypothetical protein
MIWSSRRIPQLEVGGFFVNNADAEIADVTVRRCPKQQIAIAQIDGARAARWRRQRGLAVFFSDKIEGFSGDSSCESD